MPRMISHQIDNDRMILTGGDAKRSPDHLEVKAQTFCGPQHHHGLNGRNIKALTEEVDVREDQCFTACKSSNRRVTLRGRRLAIYMLRRNAGEVEDVHGVL